MGTENLPHLYGIVTLSEAALYDIVQAKRHCPEDGGGIISPIIRGFLSADIVGLGQEFDDQISEIAGHGEGSSASERDPLPETDGALTCMNTPVPIANPVYKP